MTWRQPNSKIAIIKTSILIIQIKCSVQQVQGGNNKQQKCRSRLTRWHVYRLNNGAWCAINPSEGTYGMTGPIMSNYIISNSRVGSGMTLFWTCDSESHVSYWSKSQCDTTKANSTAGSITLQAWLPGRLHHQLNGTKVEHSDISQV